ncbi:hypothetical protein GCM10010430_80260 [Kitasatospora cystarginea]|uniref:Uncharacterized protein n=1 Tax=Kitasatospora cystarginea TaxID=58350 RepID=A0ABP5RZ60_9ACTN
MGTTVPAGLGAGGFPVSLAPPGVMVCDMPRVEQMGVEGRSAVTLCPLITVQVRETGGAQVV